jgi:hypothetical protein
MTDLQTQVYVQPSPAVEGDFASANPRFSVLSGPFALQAGVSGITIARFVWWQPTPLDPNEAPRVVNNYGAGPVTGFVSRRMGAALIQTYLQSNSMLIPAGFPVTVMNGGDFWVRNYGAGQALLGQKCYADLLTGKPSFAATASPSTSSFTGVIAAETSSVTGSITDNILTVSAVSSGTLYAGTTISGTYVATGTQINSQLTPLLAGEALGGIGRYYVSIGEQIVASTTISGTYGQLTVSALTGSVVIGGLLGGGSYTGPAGVYITAGISGTGGTGTYVVSNNTAVGSEAMTATTNVETKWIAMSSCANNELIKISDHPLG